jgi:hypothetical protein
MFSGVMSLPAPSAVNQKRIKIKCKFHLLFIEFNEKALNFVFEKSHFPACV